MGNIQHEALAKSLGVQADAVKIIDIIEVQKGRRRYLLGSIFVEIIYEVEVEDQTKAKEVESNMKAKEFKSTLDNNIKTESPNLTATVESVEEPQTRRKKLVSNYKEDGDKDVNTGDNKYVSPSAGQACKFWCALGIIVVCCTCVLCGCAGIYFYSLRSKGDPNVIRLTTSDQIKQQSNDARTISRNTWDMSAIELKARNNKSKRIKKIGKGREDRGYYPYA